jgi:AGCS family alanine or glycine:cation symporter
LVGTGIYFTFILGLLQFRHLPTALKLVFDRSPQGKTGDVSSFAALCTALSATIGTGNIVGVATAIKLGGTGALFWMWFSALFGMATKYAECLLAVKYRKTDAKGQMVGGPMYFLQYGVGSKLLATAFAVFAIGVAFFGIGTFPKVNAIVDASQLSFGVSRELAAGILTLLVAIVTIGGIQSISKIASNVVPTMALFYILACLSILIMQADQFVPAVLLAIQAGVARGVFSNESGLGSAPMAAAAEKTDSCVRQGLISMTGTFFDTILICTMTGLALILTNTW